METAIRFNSDSTDEQIIARVLGGETPLYEILMRRYNRRLYRIGKSFFSGDEQQIEEIMQLSYIRAYEKLSTFEHRSSFATWLTRIFINEALAVKRQQGKFMSIRIDDEGSERKMKYNTGRDPYTASENDELKKILEESINHLPEKYRTVFVMYEVEQLSVRETAECLGLTESNVKVRLNRARKMLRDKISSYYKTEELFSFNAVRCDRIVSNVLAVIS